MSHEQAALLDLIPFARLVGVELVTASPAEVTGRLAWQPERCTAGGVHVAQVTQTQSVLARSGG